jgi:ferric-dicitrate binding protein FerR (iron transport regulator)
LLEEAMEDCWNETASGEPPPDIDVAASLARFKEKLKRDEPKGYITTERQPARRLHSRSLAWVFVTLLFVAAGTYAVIWQTQGSKTANETVRLREIKAPEGKQTEVSLPDGSRVLLYSGGKVRFPVSFPSEARPVWLDGEAFFTVTKDGTRPFRVKTAQLTTTVLGTSFHVKAYAAEDHAQVTVVSGEVKVEAGKHSGQVVLHRQERAVYRESESLRKDSVSENETDVLQHGGLYFEDMPFGDIARQLERRYAVAIRFEHSAAADCLFSASFGRCSLKEVLDRLRMTGTFTYAIKGREVLIKGTRCK